MSDSPPPIPDSAPVGTTKLAGQTVDEGKGRIFPCDNCGADVVFHIGQQRLKCPYCGHEKEIDISEDVKVEEQDFDGMLAKVREWKEAGREAETGAHEIRCSACGATVVFTDTLTSSECPYCASPLQREHVHTATTRIPVDGVLAFKIEYETAAANLRDWVKSRWFAPNEFRKQGIEGRFNGVYLPFFTFDTLTQNKFSGQRGEHYYVTVGTGKDERQERRTAWYPVSGAFQRFFDDVLVLSARGMNHDLMQALEPWPLLKCVPFDQRFLAGFFARTYDVPLDESFRDAKQRIDAAIAADVRQRIGGDEQIVDAIRSRYDAVTFKHLLLPAWLMTYRYHQKPYQIFINAATGEVQGERPYSWIKITIAVLCGIACAALLALIFSQN